MIKDPTHAARRALNRPFSADPELNDILKVHITDRTAICQRIRHSLLFCDVFVVEVQKRHGGAAAGADVLSNSKHRFDTVVKPLTRLCTFTVEAIDAASVIAIIRKGKEEAADAGACWQYVSGRRGMKMFI